MTLGGSAGGATVRCWRPKKRFKRDFKRLPVEVKKQVKEALGALLESPPPSWIRFEKLKGYRNPNIFSIHATRNHSYKISFELDGDVAVLRRVGSHKKIDEQP